MLPKGVSYEFFQYQCWKLWEGLSAQVKRDHHQFRYFELILRTNKSTVSFIMFPLLLAEEIESNVKRFPLRRKTYWGLKYLLKISA
jgi:hypothetical protein